MIRQIHVNECNSTQDILKEQLSLSTQEEEILVSCENQVSGRGRGENIWNAMPGTLCFSLNIKPHPVMSYTALELSVLVARFFENKGAQLKLKWPNDLWNHEMKKCAGILVQGSQNQLAAGIGLNIFSKDPAYGGIFSEESGLNKKALAKEISEFILSHRYQNMKDLQKDWLIRCGHLNQMVTVTENGEVSEGIFQGIGEFGEALLCINAETRKFFNGSLRLSH